MIAAIGSIVGAVASLVGKGWQNWTELKQARYKTELSIELGKQKLVEKQIEYGHKLQVAQLRATPRWFKVVTFAGWFLPYVMVMVVPEKGLELFKNLGMAPLWYIQTSQVLLFAVWGIAVSKDTVASIFGNLVDDWKLRRRVVKLSKGFDKKALYDILRGEMGGLSQEQVDKIEEVIK